MKCAILSAAALLFFSAFSPAVALAQRILMEDFVYPSGDSLTLHGWSSSSSTGALLVAGEGLAFGAYQGSGIGGAVDLKSSGQDVQRPFKPDSSGALYVWMLVNVTSAGSGDYFAHLQPNPGSSIYAGRVYARKADSGGLAFGVAKRGTNTAPTVTYSDSIYTTGSTYLLVMKYVLSPDSTADDNVCLYVFSDGEVPGTEPWSPAVGPVTDVTADPAVLGAVALRQGDQSRAPSLRLDGLRITAGWDAYLPATLDSLRATIGGITPGVTLSWRAWTEVGVSGYALERRYPPDEGYVPVGAGVVAAVGAAGHPVDYMVVDSAVTPGAVAYRLKIQTGGPGDILADSVRLDVPTSVREESRPVRASRVGADGPLQLIVVRNYANPFNPSTIVRFASPVTQEASLDLYDILGRHCLQAFRGIARAGRTVEVRIDGSQLSTGTYLVRLTAETGTAVGKMIVLR